MKGFLFLYVIGFSIICLSQASNKLIIQDQYTGGVCFAGVDIGRSGFQTNLTIPVFIEPNSEIRKAYLLYSSLTNFDTLNVNIVINGDQYSLSKNNVSKKFERYTNEIIGFQNINLGLLDCTSSFSSNDLNIELSISEQNWNINNYDLFYFVIEYENQNLPLINTSIYVNEEKIWYPLEYQLSQHNKMDLSSDISFGLLTKSLCGDWDGYNVYLNNDSIGLIFGKDNINQSFCLGTGGHFYHQNNTSYGLDDDTPDIWMDSSDALANIQPYITNPNLFDLDFVYHTGINPGGIQTSTFPNGLTNAPVAMVLAYKPDCDATGLNIGFTDTIICKGNAINLLASGGIRYVWEPSTFLNDSTIANPICTAEKPIWYTCTMYTADSCSKTLPVFVDVLEPPTLTTTATADTCGYNTGKIFTSANGIEPLSFTINNSTPQTDTVFNNLSGGNYAITVTDGNNCPTTNQVLVTSTNITQANFTATPNVGIVPAEVEFINQSNDATNAIWYILEDTFYTQNTNYTFTDTGTYNIALIAFNNTPNCADTAYNTVKIVPPLYINIPNVITPNYDQINDIFSIDVEGADGVSCKILNRWGEVLLEYQQPINTQLQTVNIWEAITTDNTIYTDGTYFYVIYIHSPAGVSETFTGTVQVFGE